MKIKRKRTLLKQKTGLWAIEDPDTGEILDTNLTEYQAKQIIERKKYD